MKQRWVSQSPEGPVSEEQTERDDSMQFWTNNNTNYIHVKDDDDDDDAMCPSTAFSYDIICIAFSSSKLWIKGHYCDVKQGIRVRSKSYILILRTVIVNVDIFNNGCNYVYAYTEIVKVALAMY